MLLSAVDPDEGRDFIGIELDDKYFEIAKERIEEAGAE